MNHKHRLLRALCLAWILLCLHKGSAYGEGVCDRGVRILEKGDGSLRLRLLMSLKARGISEARPHCPAIPIEVGSHSQSIYVEHLQEGTHREVANVETAATVVESWVRGDISAPLLGDHTVVVAPPRVEKVVAPFPLSVSAQVESAVSLGDGSIWLGGSVTGCARLFRFCLGLTARGSADLREPEVPLYTFSRAEGALLAHGSLPLRVHQRVLLSPFVGLGAGFTWVELLGDPLGGSAFGWGLRAELGLGVSARLLRLLSAEFTLSFAAAYPSQPAALRVVAIRDVHQGRGSDDPQDIALPGGPLALLRLGIGFRIGEIFR